MALPSLAPRQYYGGVRRRPRLSPYITGMASQLPAIYALQQQEESAEKQFGLEEKKLEQQTLLDTERTRAISEASAAGITSAEGLATKRASLDKLLTTETARSNELIARNRIASQEKTATKARNLGYVSTGLKGLSLASDIYGSGLAESTFDVIGNAISTVGGWLGF